MRGHTGRAACPMASACGLSFHWALSPLEHPTTPLPSRETLCAGLCKFLMLACHLVHVPSPQKPQVWCGISSTDSSDRRSVCEDIGSRHSGFLVLNAVSSCTSYTMGLRSETRSWGCSRGRIESRSARGHPVAGEQCGGYVNPWQGSRYGVCM